MGKEDDDVDNDGDVDSSDEYLKKRRTALVKQWVRMATKKRMRKKKKIKER